MLVGDLMSHRQGVPMAPWMASDGKYPDKMLIFWSLFFMLNLSSLMQFNCNNFNANNVTFQLLKFPNIAAIKLSFRSVQRNLKCQSYHERKTIFKWLISSPIHGFQPGCPYTQRGLKFYNVCKWLSMKRFILLHHTKPYQALEFQQIAIQEPSFSAVLRGHSNNSK